MEYYDDKKDPENYVYIGVEVKGLEKTLIGSNAKNADITFDRTDRYVWSHLVNILRLTVNKQNGYFFAFCTYLPSFINIAMHCDIEIYFDTDSIIIPA